MKERKNRKSRDNLSTLSEEWYRSLLDGLEDVQATDQDYWLNNTQPGLFRVKGGDPGLLVGIHRIAIEDRDECEMNGNQN